MNPLAVLLAAVFGWAGLAKLRHRERTTSSFVAFGLPRPGTLAVAVPVAELALALVLVGWPVAGATLALATLAGLTTQLVLARRRGVDAGCGCFGGTVAASPAVEVARNAALAIVAVAVIMTV